MHRTGLLVALVALAAATSQGASADTLPRAPIAGVTRAATVASRVAVRASADAAPVTLSVTFKPRNAALLERLAATRSGAQGLSTAELARLFGPSRSELDGMSAYLRGHGLRPTGGGILTRSYAGSVAETEAAFATQLESYRSGGVSFRAPASTPTLPAALASGVLAISGLDTYPLATPALAPRAAPVNPLVGGCAPGASIHTSWGGYEPAQLAAASAYNSQPLLDQGASGAGNAVALVEFSNYSAAPVQTYQDCYGTSVPITDVAVNGSTTDLSGDVEVQLDEEVLVGSAPGLDHIYTYVAPNGTSWAAMIDRIVDDRASTGVDEISISWGACEAAMGSGYMNASHAEFAMAAAAGLSIYAASGDNGSADCEPFNSSTAAAVDYPASDPSVTGVGGTTLNTRHRRGRTRDHLGLSHAGRWRWRRWRRLAAVRHAQLAGRRRRDRAGILLCRGLWPDHGQLPRGA